jgi:uncharacterized membrane protein
MKTSIALIVGVVLLVGGLAGGAVFVLDSQKPEEPRRTAAQIVAERVEKAIAARDSLREEKERLARLQKTLTRRGSKGSSLSFRIPTLSSPIARICSGRGPRMM